jgi:mRNA interferase MazF
MMLKTGDVILVPFPFAEHTQVKVRPSVVICLTQDQFRDVVVAAVSSVLPIHPTRNEIIIQADSSNRLRTTSVIKVDRIVTIKSNDIITRLGELSADDLTLFKGCFKKLVD